MVRITEEAKLEKHRHFRVCEFELLVRHGGDLGLGLEFRFLWDLFDVCNDEEYLEHQDRVLENIHI